MSTDSTVTAEYPPWIQYIVEHHTETVGCWFLGGIGDIMMQGAIIVMTAEYFSRSRRDPTYLRAVVLGLSVVNMLKTIQTIAVLWYKLVWGFGDYISASGSTWYSSSIVITAQFICTGVQVFFTHRLGRLLHWKGFWWILAPLVLAILMGVGGAIALTVAVFAEPGVVAMANFERIIIIQLTGNLASDTFVTFLTSAYLVLSRTGIERTDSLIQRLLRLTWLTALPPTICAALHLATYVELSASGNSLWVVFSFWAPKLYTISMLYTLNARGTLFNEDSYIMTSRIISVPLTSDLQFASPDSRNTGMRTGAAAESSLCELSKVGPMSSTIASSVEGADRHSLKDDLHSSDLHSPWETRFSTGHVSTDGGSRRTAVHSLVDTGKRSSGVGDAASQHVSFHTPSKS